MSTKRIVITGVLNTYQKYDYKLLDVPFGTVENRIDSILKTLTIL